MLLQQFGGVYEDQQLQQYVNEVGQRAAKASQRPELQYTFTVLDSDEINAFTTGGGYVYITRGIMNYLNSEAELAAVLGHEIGHVTARHPVRQQTQVDARRHRRRRRRHLHGQRRSRGSRELRRRRARQRLRPRPGARSGSARRGVPGRRPATAPGHMIDVVRLLKNQELFEIAARPRGEARAARLSRRVRDATRTTTRACTKS